ncbi:MAG: inositol 2-dehydrogenase [Pelagibacteraceae bacterium]|nr:inositol 2-dehydrogenase [Pelagibacteraceae bacterium]PHX88910.1 MAG: inositol 2-dehydrogenase [Pelagibacteraceae bacterium]
MIKFALMGAGRIGKMHAAIINSHPGSSLKYVFDTNTGFSEQVAKANNSKVAKSPEEAITSSEVDAVLIASATPTHTRFITMAAKAGKAIFCEKPIDLDIGKVNQCMEEIKGINVPLQIGFNRRFDKSHAKAQQARVNKEIGELEMLIITSRDPEPPGIEYLKAAGGFFRDTTIHDFDLSRFILGDDPIIQISAFGDALFDENAKKTKDLDTAMFIMRSKSGVLIHVNNSRRAVYGYDQRVEVFGSKGMIISDNQIPNSIKIFDKYKTNAQDPIHFFFIERYEQAYKDQFNAFMESIKNKTKPKVTFEDGRNALIIANAAYQSLESRKTIDINFN